MFTSNTANCTWVDVMCSRSKCSSELTFEKFWLCACLSTNTADCTWEVQCVPVANLAASWLWKVSELWEFLTLWMSTSQHGELYVADVVYSRVHRQANILRERERERERERWNAREGEREREKERKRGRERERVCVCKERARKKERESETHILKRQLYIHFSLNSSSQTDFWESPLFSLSLSLSPSSSSSLSLSLSL